MSKLSQTLAAAAVLLGVAAPIAVQAADDAPANNPNEINFCAGSKKGVYTQVAEFISQQAKGRVKVNVVNTGGAAENIEKINSGECDVGFAQPDMLDAYNSSHKGAPLTEIAESHPEYTFYVCNNETIEKYGIKRVTRLLDPDVKKEVSIFIGPNGGGTEATIHYLQKADKRYQDLSLITGTMNSITMSKFAVGKAFQCAIMNIGIGSQAMADLENIIGDKVSLVPFDDSDLFKVKGIDGKPVYVKAEIPGKLYPKLSGSIHNTFTNNNIPTAVQFARVVTNDDRLEEKAEAMDKFVATWLTSQGAIRNAFTIK